jgi:hypothetical protein
MTAMQIAGSLLRASDDDRVLTYLLAPFGEPGRTNLGKVTLTAASLTIPEDVTGLTVNSEHVSTAPVGKFARVEATDKGYEADVRFLATRAGDDALLEAREGVRKGISVEVENPVIRGGQMLAGVLSGAGVCVTPAYPSALLVAADAGDLPDYLQDSNSTSVSTEEVVINGVTYVVKRTNESTTTTAPKDGETNADQSAESESTVGNSLAAAAPAAAPAGLHASTTTKRKQSADDVFKMLASEFRSGGESKMFAALTNIVHDDGDNDGDGLGEIAASVEWLGELYNRAAYVRKYIPLIAQGTLTAYQQKGFNFGTLPVVQKYSGNKTDVPTGGMTATPVSYLVDRWAHAADLDRRYVDFSDQEIIKAFIEAQVESYKKETDKDTLANIVAKANVFTPGTVPSGINATLAAIVDGALTLIGADFNPTFAIVGSDIYRGLALTKKDEVPEYLSAAIGLKEGSADGFRIVPSSHASALQNVIVGDGSTVRFKELGGGSPIRVEAEHVAQGGKDFGVFGYTSFQELIDGGVVKADLVP